jgi:hypothetical protein
MKVKLILKNDLGEFESNIMQCNQDEYLTMLNMSKSFYSSGFEMYLENGFMVVPPEIVRKSILIIKIIEKENGIEEEI